MEQNEQNLFDLIPEQKNEFEKTEDGIIWVIQPKFKSKFMVKYVVPRLKRPYFKVKLDEFGSAVWEYIDGQRTIKQIGEKLHADFGEKVEPVYERLAVFFQSLQRLRFIQYKNYVKPKK